MFFFFWCVFVVEVLEAIDEFNDLQYLAWTKGSSSALVGGRHTHTHARTHARTHVCIQPNDSSRVGRSVQPA